MLHGLWVSGRGGTTTRVVKERASLTQKREEIAGTHTRISIWIIADKTITIPSTSDPGDAV